MAHPANPRAAPEQPLTVGRIVAAYGVKGWVKIESSTAPASNILDYRPWWLCEAGVWRAVEHDAGRMQGSQVVAHLAGVDDRDQALRHCKLDIHVEKALLPPLAEGEYYWHELVGLAVYGRADGFRVRLGRVASLLETGANDVLVVRGDEQSLDRAERLIPYADRVVLAIDREAGTLDVDWGPDY